MSRFRAVIFDLGGTLVDKYSMTPLLSFQRVLQNHNLVCSHQTIIKDMGKEKREHISELLRTRENTERWLFRYGRKPQSSDCDKLFEEFTEIQREQTHHHLQILPETLESLRHLRDSGIKIGVTTGFSKELMDIVRDKLSDEHIPVDEWVSSTCLDLPGRPAPHMIYELMRRFQITNPRSILKVDDTNVGLLEGKNAGCLTMGVARWSINMNVRSLDEIRMVEENPEVYYEKLRRSRKKLYMTKPDYVVDSLKELRNLIEREYSVSKKLTI